MKTLTTRKQIVHCPLPSLPRVTQISSLLQQEPEDMDIIKTDTETNSYSPYETSDKFRYITDKSNMAWLLKA